MRKRTLRKFGGAGTFVWRYRVAGGGRMEVGERDLQGESIKGNMGF